MVVSQSAVLSSMQGGVLRSRSPALRRATRSTSRPPRPWPRRWTGRASSDVRSVLICAAGADFSVGGDIHFFDGDRDSLPERISTLVSTLHSAVLGLALLDVPVVSAVQGWCAGAGIGFACGADIVVAADNARFRSSYTAIGFTPDLGLTWLLPRLVGPMRAADVLYTNRAVSAAEALDWGLVSRVVAADELASAAATLLAQLADGPAGAHGLLRGLLRKTGSRRPPARAAGRGRGRHLGGHVRRRHGKASPPSSSVGRPDFRAVAAPALVRCPVSTAHTPRN